MLPCRRPTMRQKGILCRRDKYRSCRGSAQMGTRPTAFVPAGPLLLSCGHESIRAAEPAHAVRSGPTGPMAKASRGGATGRISGLPIARPLASQNLYPLPHTSKIEGAGWLAQPSPGDSPPSVADSMNARRSHQFAYPRSETRGRATGSPEKCICRDGCFRSMP